jgi:hypothetical protein
MRASEFAVTHGYIGWELGASDRAQLLGEFPPKYPDVIAHHITHHAGASSDEALPEAHSIRVVGYVDDGEGLECLVCEVDGSTQRDHGGQYHITWSIDRAAGYKPVHSNKVIAQHDIQTLTPAINIAINPKFFGKP